MLQTNSRVLTDGKLGSIWHLITQLIRDKDNHMGTTKPRLTSKQLRIGD